MKIAIIGYGKMGKEIEKIALRRGHEIILRINSKNANELHTKNLKEVDVAIEFSGPASAFENIRTCLNANTSVISGSTGWIERMNEIEELALERKLAFLYASNFSLGVNVFFALNQMMAKLLSRNQEYKIELKESHHTEKKDAPSGTAITLANAIIEASGQRYREWILDGDDSTQLNIHAERLKGVPGTHEISYESAIDRIELKHIAHSRVGFALGAVIATEFVKDKRGVFSMKDVLNV